MSRFMVLFLIVCACVITAPAFAQNSAPTALELCKTAPDKDRTECEKELSEIEEMLGPGLWNQFASCAATKNFSNEKAVIQCFSDDMIKRLMAVSEAKAAGQPIPPPPTVTSLPPSTYVPPTTPANGIAFSLEEVCASARKDKRDECIKELSEIKKIFDDAMWTEFALCGVKVDFSVDNGREAITCLSPAMIERLQADMEKKMETEMKKVEEEAKKAMEEEMKKNPSPSP